MNKPKDKRGKQLIVIETGQNCNLERIQENGNYFVDFGDGAYQSIDPIYLKPVGKDKQPINKVSDNKKAEDKIYSTLRKVFLDNHITCEAKILGCTKQATEVHHKKGRVGKNYLDVHTFLALCHNCHSWIETHPQWAKEFGYSGDRL